MVLVRISHIAGSNVGTLGICMDRNDAIKTNVLTCVICGVEFKRPGKHGPRPQFCSLRCKGKRDRSRPGRKEYERDYRRAARNAGKLKAYERAYYQRPEVRARYLARYYAFYRDPFIDIPINNPYTGHRWLDMARQAVLKGKDLDATAPWADDYYDEMGEAVLALLEGRDMETAIKKYRSEEYPARMLSIRLDDWRDDDNEGRWFDRITPPVPSAEDTYLDTIEYTEKARFRNVSVGSRGRRMKHKTSTPTNRRSNNR